VEIQVGRTVTDLEWKRRDVKVHITNPSGSSLGPFSARAVILTVPHAVLKDRAVQIRPSITRKQRALEQLEVGHIFKLALQFRDNFWSKDEFLQKRIRHRTSSPHGLAAPIFVHSQDQEIPVWWTQAPSTTPVLTAWAGGPKAEALLSESYQTRLEKSLNALAVVFGMSRKTIDDLLASCCAHDWTADPLSRGAYTYVSVSAARAAEVLAEPVQKTLFFAGEATDADEMGTVAAAIATGKRAGEQCARALLARR
jgi:monoamine oxidase